MDSVRFYRHFILISAVLLSVLPAVAAQGRFVNHPLPSGTDTLRILAVGNSFSDDGTEYLPSLLEAAGIHNVVLGRLYIGGCSLERHCREYEEGLSDYMYSKSASNRWVTVAEKTGILTGLHDEKWDVVTIQETSGLGGIYDSYAEWIPRLLEIIVREVSNPALAVYWHQTWAYSVNSTHSSFPLYGNDQKRMYEGIVDCVSRASEEFSLPVIPSGTAVQIARGTALNNVGRVPEDSKVYDLTRDGYHLGRQFGRYIAACTWFETLICPVFGISVRNNGCTLLDTEFSLCRKDAELCRKCAVKAVKQWAK